MKFIVSYIFVFVISVLIPQISFSQRSTMSPEVRKYWLNHVPDTRNPTYIISQPALRDTAVWLDMVSRDEIKYFSESAMEILYWINYVRMYPRKFYDLYAQKHIKTYYSLDDVYAVTLKQDLYNASPLSPLKPSKLLYETSAMHSLDMVKSHKFQHESSGGTSFVKRMGASGITCANENLYNGVDKPFFVVVELLIDAGISNLGHRKNILNSTMKTTGISYKKYDDSTVIMVQDFSCMTITR
jgi:hypothetical protein